ncbi:MAG: hypothetical protein ABEI80_04595 [Haloplanus sp.]
MAACTYCGCDVTAHDPVYVEGVEDGERVSAGRFCNYGCLAAYIEAEGLVEGTTCRLD